MARPGLEISRLCIRSSASPVPLVRFELSLVAGHRGPTGGRSRLASGGPPISGPSCPHLPRCQEEGVFSEVSVCATLEILDCTEQVLCEAEPLVRARHGGEDLDRVALFLWPLREGALQLGGVTLNLLWSIAQEGHSRRYALGGHYLAPLAGIQIRSERDIALVREATSHVLYVIDEAPYLLYHDERRGWSLTFRQSEIAIYLPTAAREPNFLRRADDVSPSTLQHASDITL